jgi:uncharacterized protein YndB with AHSA1/START domain
MPAQPSLTLQRRINATPTKIHSAWTEPSQIVKWMHPGIANVIHVEMDVRVGGRFRLIMRAPDCEEHNEAARDNHETGWGQALDGLAPQFA